MNDQRVLASTEVLGHSANEVTEVRHMTKIMAVISKVLVRPETSSKALVFLQKEQ